jgi:CDGSH-type Zn-finger protein
MPHRNAGSNHSTGEEGNLSSRQKKFQAIDRQGGIMARLVKRLRNRPYAVIIGGEAQYFCGCGLSNAQPFCDGTHKIALAEESGKLYWYDKTGRRQDAADNYPDIRDDLHTQEV